MPRQTVRLICLIPLFLAVLSPLPADSFVLNSSYSPPYSTDAGDGILELVLSEAFERLGHSVAFRRLPAERALLDAHNGAADGVVARIPGIQAMYSDLRFVPSATIPQREFVAFVTNEEIEITRWSDLAPHNVAFVRGWKIIEANVPARARVVRAPSTELAFRLLARGRTDVVISARLDGLAMASEIGIPAVYVQEPPLTSQSLYPYLHRDHEALIDPLAQALDEVKEDGTFDRIYDEAMAAFEAEE